MQKQSAKKITVAVALVALLFEFACAHKKPAFQLSHLKNINLLETEDHNSCLSLKLNFDGNNDVTSALYWRCRLSFAKYRLYTTTETQEKLKHNLEISDLVSKISLKIANISEPFLLRETKKLDNLQHKKCLEMGFEIDSEDQAKIDDYFGCRRALLEEYKLLPPYRKEAYRPYPHRSYNLGFVVDQRVDAEIKRYESAKEKYPDCVKFGVKSQNFRNCTAAYDKAWSCFGEIEKKKFKRDQQEKLSCQKQSYGRFPDSMLKSDDDDKKTIERMNNNSDFYNAQSISSLGLDNSQFSAEKPKTDEKNPKKSAEEINSKNNLYDKFELTNLRKTFIVECQKEADVRVASFVDDLKNSCEALKKFDVLGE